MLILLTHLIYNMTIQINNIMRMIIMLSNVLWADFLLLYAIVSDDYINIITTVVVCGIMGFVYLVLLPLLIHLYSMLLKSLNFVSVAS